MHVMILGGGVVGVTSAYYLAKAGHQVTVLERQPARGWRPASPMPGRSRLVTRPRGRRRAFR